jgi:hypothetical protein
VDSPGEKFDGKVEMKNEDYTVDELKWLKSAVKATMFVMRKIQSLPLVVQYVIAGAVSFVTALVTAILFLAITGEEKGPIMLVQDRDVAFFAIMAGGFCFPIFSRWFRSTVLLLFGLVFYCFITRPTEDDYFLQLYPYPSFLSLLFGGLAAIVVHGFIDLARFFLRRFRIV